MKTKSTIPMALVSIGLLLISQGCASIMPGQAQSGKDISASGPSILNPRVEPSTIELNRHLQPTRTPEILTDVKDFRGKITDVKVQFLHVPLEAPMENTGGTTWRAEITPRQLQMLAVSGKTVKYEANIVARNDKGQVAVSKEPVTVTIKAPDMGESAT